MASSDQTSTTTISITLPSYLAEKAEARAESEGKSLHDLVDEAFRDYMSDVPLRTMEDIRRYAQTRNPKGYTEKDVPRIVKEVRAEMAAERDAEVKTAKAS